jgi:hypothetical protein
MQAVILICDECGSELGADGRFRSAMEARAAAYGAGWRFPPALSSSGSEGSRSHDACPDCAPTWRPRQFTRAGHKQYREIGGAS